MRKCRIGTAKFFTLLLLLYRTSVKDQGISPATCNVRLSAIKNYVQYAADCDISLQSIALLVSKVPGQKIPGREKLLLSEKALSALFAQPNESKIGIRNRTIMILLYDAAIRVSELTGLHMNDVSLDTLSVHVIGKGNKERTVAITRKTAEHIKKYLSAYNPGNPNNSEKWLFFTVIKGKSGQISVSTVERFLQKYADQARETCPEMPVRVYPHLLRAERATHLYRDGVESALISKMLGHSSVETTKIYALPSLDQMREVLEKVQSSEIREEKPLWEAEGEEELARLCGLR